MAPRTPKKPAATKPSKPTGAARVAELEQTLAERDAALASLQQRLTDAPSGELIATHEELLRVAGERVASLEARLKEAQGQTAALTQLLADVEARALEREAALQALTEAYADAQARLSFLTRDAERTALLEEAAADSGLLLIALEREIATLRAQLAAASVSA